MLRIASTGAPLPPGRFDALAATSANGLRALDVRGLDVRGLDVPVFAVGPRTAAAARSAGFRQVVDCAGDAVALAGRLDADLPPGARILHAAGADRAADLAALLTRADVKVIVHVGYLAPEAAGLAPETQAALRDGALDAALHFSPRTVRALLRCVDDAGLREPFGRLRHLCLSEAVAAPLQATGLPADWAPRPNADALLGLLEGEPVETVEVAPGGPGV